MTVEPVAPSANATPVAKTAPWLATGERSNLVAVRFMAWIAVFCGRTVARLVLHPITLYFLLFAPSARRSSAQYLQRALGRQATWQDQYKHFHSFASVVLDRVYFARGQTQAFDLKLLGTDELHAALDLGRGAFLLGAHLGSFEALHAIGANRPGMRVAHVMYPHNAQMIQSVLQAMASDFRLNIITIGRPGSTLEIRDWLDAGGLVGLLGDRWLAQDETAASNVNANTNTTTTKPAATSPASRSNLLQRNFLGHPAKFIDGPLRLAQLLRRRVLFMVGIYRGGRRYDLHFKVLADFSTPPRNPADREAALQQALTDYVGQLETLCRQHPYNWFNFYDFWT